jgi:hypothetical protein
LPLHLPCLPLPASACLQVLYDIGAVSTAEPFQRLVSQGMILGEVEYSVYRDADGACCPEGTHGAQATRCVANLCTPAHRRTVSALCTAASTRPCQLAAGLLIHQSHTLAPLAAPLLCPSPHLA